MVTYNILYFFLGKKSVSRSLRYHQRNFAASSLRRLGHLQAAAAAATLRGNLAKKLRKGPDTKASGWSN